MTRKLEENYKKMVWSLTFEKPYINYGKSREKSRNKGHRKIKRNLNLNIWDIRSQRLDPQKKR